MDERVGSVGWGPYLEDASTLYLGSYTVDKQLFFLSRCLHSHFT